MRITGKDISFKGKWKPDRELSGQLNNEQELKEFARISDVDFILTNADKSNKYLKEDNAYCSLSSKKIKGKLFYGIDCVFLPKDAPKETVSEQIFKSVQKSVSMLYENIAKYNVKQSTAQQAVQDEAMQYTKLSLNLIKKMFNVLFKSIK